MPLSTQELVSHPQQDWECSSASVFGKFLNKHHLPPQSCAVLEAVVYIINNPAGVTNNGIIHWISSPDNWAPLAHPYPEMQRSVGFVFCIPPPFILFYQLITEAISHPVFIACCCSCISCGSLKNLGAVQAQLIGWRESKMAGGFHFLFVVSYFHVTKSLG